MIAVRCQSCARRFALFCMCADEPCVFCGARQIVAIGEDNGTTPALPPVKEPPAMERVPITERTVSIARALVEQALGQESESCDE
ncbi:MAG: hypothetical protein AB7R89_13920 [Dehalococcoidia bacterium]